MNLSFAQVSRRVTFTVYAMLAFAVSPALFISLTCWEYCSLAISENLLCLLSAILPHNYKIKWEKDLLEKQSKRA